jgi:hypothetical protein
MDRKFKRVLEKGVPNEKLHLLEDSDVIALCGKKLTAGARWVKVQSPADYERCSSCSRKYHFIKVGEANSVQVESETA